MLGNVAVDGVVGLVPFAGDAFDVVPRQYAQHAAPQALDGQAAENLRIKSCKWGAVAVRKRRGAE
jgi:hypothetical protein